MHKLTGLSLRREACPVLGNAEFLGDCFCRACPISGEHDDPHSEITEFPNQLFCRRTDRILKDEEAGRHFIHRHRHQAARDIGSQRVKWSRIDAPLSQEFCRSHENPLFLHKCRDASAGERLEGGGLGNLNLLLTRMGHDGSGKRMLTPEFRPRCQHQQSVFIQDTEGVDRDKTRLSLGQGARLVESDEIHRSQTLKGLSRTDKDAVGSSPADPDHQGHRRGETKSAGAGNHDDGNCGRDGGKETGLRPKQHPECEGDDTDTENDRNKNRSYPVGKLLDRRLAPLGLSYQLDDPGESCLSPCPGYAHDEAPRGVQGAGRDHRTDGFFHRQGLTSHHRFVDGTPPLDDLPIGGEFLPRKDADSIVRT